MCKPETCRVERNQINIQLHQVGKLFHISGFWNFIYLYIWFRTNCCYPTNGTFGFPWSTRLGMPGAWCSFLMLYCIHFCSYISNIFLQMVLAVCRIYAVFLTFLVLPVVGQHVEWCDWLVTQNSSYWHHKICNISCLNSHFLNQVMLKKSLPVPAILPFCICFLLASPNYFKLWKSAFITWHRTTMLKCQDW